MSLLALELSDAGIVAAGGTPPRILPVDGKDRESPGVALSNPAGMLFGVQAYERARLNPRSYTDRFWYELDTETLAQPGFEETNNTELACSHLRALWEQLQAHGDELILAVPGFFSQRQLGLVLGVAQELSLHVRGLVPLSLAAAYGSLPETKVFHCDMHMHAVEITCLNRTDCFTIETTQQVADWGISRAYAEWVRAIADVFVQATRFDPLDQAAYEQELYRRVPEILTELRHSTQASFTMQAGSQTHHVTLTHELLAEKCAPLCSQIAETIQKMIRESASTEVPHVIVLTHRIDVMPGLRKALEKIKHTRITALSCGAGAMGALCLYRRFPEQSSAEGVTLLSSRQVETKREVPESDAVMQEAPTHILHGCTAYAISEKPIVLELKKSTGIIVSRCSGSIHDSSVSCTIHMRGQEVVLTYDGPAGVMVDGIGVSGSASLKVGQTVQLSSDGEGISMIRVLKTDET